jgi:hypothetical protein
VSQPPSVGPSTGATTTPRANTAMANPRFCGGKVSSRIDCESGCRAPPPAPCTARAIRIKARLVAAPQAKEETVKMTMQVMRNRLRPKRSENQELAGKIMALATR